MDPRFASINILYPIPTSFENHVGAWKRTWSAAVLDEGVVAVPVGLIDRHFSVGDVAMFHKILITHLIIKKVYLCCDFFLSNPVIMLVLKAHPNEFLLPSTVICSVVDLDLYVFGPPGSASGSVSHKYGSGSDFGSFRRQAKNRKKNLDF